MNEGIYSEIASEALKKVSGKVKDIAGGSKIVAVETDAGVGLAFVTGPLVDPAKYIGANVADMVNDYATGDLTTTAYCLAALNSFLVHRGKPDNKSWPERLNHAKKLAMVGAFGPVIEELQNTGIEVVVFELKDMPGAHKPSEAAALMPGCDAVLMTGATFSNRTAHTYFPHITPEADAHISGPSTPMTDALLKRFTLGSSIVTNKEEVFKAVRDGKCINCISKYLEKVIIPRAAV